jgi:hypothetical protein
MVINGEPEILVAAMSSEKVMLRQKNDPHIAAPQKTEHTSRLLFERESRVP